MELLISFSAVHEQFASFKKIEAAGIPFNIAIQTQFVNQNEATISFNDRRHLRTLVSLHRRWTF